MVTYKKIHPLKDYMLLFFFLIIIHNIHITFGKSKRSILICALLLIKGDVYYVCASELINFNRVVGEGASINTLKINKI